MLFIIPVIDMIPYWIDTCVIKVSFKAGKTLTVFPNFASREPISSGG